MMSLERAYQGLALEAQPTRVGFTKGEIMALVVWTLGFILGVAF